MGGSNSVVGSCREMTANKMYQYLSRIMVFFASRRCYFVYMQILIIIGWLCTWFGLVRFNTTQLGVVLWMDCRYFGRQWLWSWYTCFMKLRLHIRVMREAWCVKRDAWFVLYDSTSTSKCDALKFFLLKMLPSADLLYLFLHTGTWHLIINI